MDFFARIAIAFATATNRLQPFHLTHQFVLIPFRGQHPSIVLFFTLKKRSCVSVSNGFFPTLNKNNYVKTQRKTDYSKTICKTFQKSYCIRIFPFSLSKWWLFVKITQIDQIELCRFGFWKQKSHGVLVLCFPTTIGWDRSTGLKREPMLRPHASGRLAVGAWKVEIYGNLRTCCSKALKRRPGKKRKE